jgi:hypothetical protein
MTEYRYLATSPTGLIQQLAVCLLPTGYHFYTAGTIPPHKDPTAVDAKLLDRYAIAASRHAKYRQSKAGFAKVQYLRCGSFFVLVATLGVHPIFGMEADNLKDFRRNGLRFADHLVTIRNGHSRVSIAPEKYREVKRWFVDRALKRTAGELLGDFQALPFESYSGVVAQLFNILRAVNRRRKAAGLKPLPWEPCIRVKRRKVKVFADEPKEVVALA